MDIPRKTTLLTRLTKYRIPIAAIAVLTIAIIAFGINGSGGANIPQSELNSLVIDEVKVGQFNKEINGIGNLQPTDFEWLTTKARVTVKEVLVKPGALVNTDTVLVYLTSPELVEARDVARWSLEEAKADVDAQALALQNQLLNLKSEQAKLKSDLDYEKVKLDAESELVEKGIISKVNYRQTKIRVANLKHLIEIEAQRIKTFEQSVKSQLEIMDNRVQLLAKQLKVRQDNVDALTVTSSLDGVVQEVIVENGQNLAAGAQLALVADVDNLIAELRIPESFAKDLNLQQLATVDTRNGMVDGYVSRIDPRVVNGTVLVDVTFTESLPQNARPDQSVEGTIHINSLDNIKYINKPALASANSYSDLFVLNQGNELAERRRVQFGISSVNKIQVLNGLNAGDRVVISDISQWQDHQKLIIKR